MCATCGQCFTGETQMGSAETWWAKVRDLPSENLQRLAASGTLANALAEQGGLFARAEAMYRELLSAQRRVLGPEHPETLMSSSNLANTLYSQGKYTDAETMQRDALSVQRRVLGPNHPSTLISATSLANMLNS